MTMEAKFEIKSTTIEVVTKDYITFKELYKMGDEVKEILYLDSIIECVDDTSNDDMYVSSYVSVEGVIYRIIHGFPGGNPVGIIFKGNEMVGAIGHGDPGEALIEEDEKLDKLIDWYDNEDGISELQ
jgi:hypothetical protein